MVVSHLTKLMPPDLIGDPVISIENAKHEIVHDLVHAIIQADKVEDDANDIANGGLAVGVLVGSGVDSVLHDLFLQNN